MEKPKGTVYYMQVVPDSHYWTNLESLIRSLELDVEWHASKKERKKRIKESKGTIIDCYEPLTMEYLLIGLKNAQEKGYDLKKLSKKKKKKKNGKK